MKAYLDTDQWRDFLGEEPKCREERQFALFLYLAFLEKRSGNLEKRKEKDLKSWQWITNTINGCLDEKDCEGENIIIEDVYYEATLMRDYFDRCEDKKEFNHALLHFCLDFLFRNTKKDGGKTECEMAEDCIKNVDDGSINYNLGTTKMKCTVEKTYKEIKKKIEEREMDKQELQKVYERACFDIARMMMNATPDILVIYRRKEDREERYFAKALECKYQSEQGSYKDVAGVRIKMQYFIQECVMSFLFGGNPAYKEKVPEKRLPKVPTKGDIWYDEKKIIPLYDQLQKTVYEGILKNRSESRKIINKGVKEIRFSDGKDQKDDDTIYCKKIDVRELLKYMYTKGQV